jgi:hypothetical protein
MEMRMSIFDNIEGLEPVDPEKLEPFEREMRESVIPELLEKRRAAVWPVGWFCGNCRRWHAPHVHTCPDPPAGDSLRERLRRAGNRIDG